MAMKRYCTASRPKAMAVSYFEKKLCVSKILILPRMMICDVPNLKIVFDISNKSDKSISLEKITMKNLILLLAILSSVLIFSQTKESTSKNQVYEMVDRAAQFPDGMTGFRTAFAKNVDVNKIAGKGTEVTFVVERDGSISNLKATGQNQSFNEQAVRAIKKIRTKWIPAKVNDVPVRARFKFPAKANI
jgi:hypothetical protein